MNTKLHFSSVSNEWETPVAFFQKYNKIYNFDIDVCAADNNHLCEKYYTISDDALTKDWVGNCWMNPPYGRSIVKFVEKAYLESLKKATVVCLIPSRTDTLWWHNFVMKGEIEFIKGRLKFINRLLPSYKEDGSMKISSAPFPSAVVVFKNQEQAKKEIMETNFSTGNKQSAPCNHNKGYMEEGDFVCEDCGDVLWSE